MSFTFSEQDVGRIARAVRAFENDRGDGGGGSPVSTGLVFQFAMFRVKSVGFDHLVCRILDGASTQNEGTIDVKVAKPYVLRASPYNNKTITFNGVALSFSYANGFTRTVTKGAVSQSETQIIIPAYTGTGTGYLGETVVAATGLPTGVRLNPGQANEEILVWLDLNLDGRMWAKST